jgi:hypothetical protein
MTVRSASFHTSGLIGGTKLSTPGAGSDKSGNRSLTVESTDAPPSPDSAGMAGGAAMIPRDRNSTTSVKIVLGNMVPSLDDPEFRILQK